MTISQWLRRRAEKRRIRAQQPVYRVRSAESPNAGAFIPGASEEARRIGARIREELAVEDEPHVWWATKYGEVVASAATSTELIQQIREKGIRGAVATYHGDHIDTTLPERAPEDK